MVILGVLELDFDIEDLLLDKIDDEVLLELLADVMSSTDDICGLVLVLTPGVKPLSPPVPPPPVRAPPRKLLRLPVGWPDDGKPEDAWLAGC